MKIAVTGKGGVGKTTISAMMAKALNDAHYSVILVDADPDSNLPRVLGVPPDINLTPIIEMKELIAERTESKPDSYGAFFKLNPRVDDIPDRFCINHKGIKLIVMGNTKKGGGGCACPENVFIKSLIGHLLLGREEVVIMDMVAGTEHLGRATAKGVDEMWIVVEPGLKSIDTAKRIKTLSNDIGIKEIKVIGNKVRSEKDGKFIRNNIGGIAPILTMIPYSQNIVVLEMGEKTLFDDDIIPVAIKELVDKFK